MAKQRFKKGQKLREMHLRRLEQGNRANRVLPSAGMLVAAGRTGTTVTPMSVPATGTGVGTGQAWAKLTHDNGDGTYAWAPTLPAGPVDYWADGSASSTLAVEANLSPGLPIPSRVPFSYDGAGRARFQMELCV